jgi:hypothetical protein
LTIAILLLTIISCSVLNKAVSISSKNAENRKLTDSMKIEKLYAQITREADDAFDNKKYHLAISKYQDALNVKNEEYPKNQILKINHIMHEQPRQDNLKKFAQVVERGDEYADIKTVTKHWPCTTLH